MTESKKPIPPRIIAVRLNETEHWSDNITSRSKNIYGHYLYDENLVTHICSFDKHYFLRFVGYDFESEFDANDPRYEELDMEIMDGYHSDDMDSYYPIQTIDRIPFGDYRTSGEYRTSFLETMEAQKILDDQDGGEARFWDMVVEYFHGNPVL